MTVPNILNVYEASEKEQIKYRLKYVQSELSSSGGGEVYVTSTTWLLQLHYPPLA